MLTLKNSKNNYDRCETHYCYKDDLKSIKQEGKHLCITLLSLEIIIDIRCKILTLEDIENIYLFILSEINKDSTFETQQFEESILDIIK